MHSNDDSSTHIHVLATQDQTCREAVLKLTEYVDALWKVVASQTRVLDIIIREVYPDIAERVDAGTNTEAGADAGEEGVR